MNEFECFLKGFHHLNKHLNDEEMFIPLQRPAVEKIIPVSNVIRYDKIEFNNVFKCRCRGN